MLFVRTLLLLIASLLMFDSSLTDASSSDYSLYIVYLGGKGGQDSAAIIRSHHELVASVTESEVPATVVHSYKHGFNGFSARMTKKQAESIASLPNVVSVFPSKRYQLHTTRSWDFLGVYQPQKLYLKETEGVVIGIMDTGIWPESESFSDSGLGPAPSRWKGTCNNTGITNSSELVTCNNKIIGARFYSSSGFASDAQKGISDDIDDKAVRKQDYQNARDDEGHGTHTASTAAGREVSKANMLGIASGTARGGLESAKIAVYKVCGGFGCFESDIMAAFDDAIGDGVDVLSLSLGGAAQNYDEDGIAIGAFHAVEHGIAVSCSAGNSGPDASSVSNSAPWIVTVGASTMDRGISSLVVLGNNKTLQGTALNLHKQTNSPARLVYAGDILKKAQASDSSNCDPDGMDLTKVKNKIVVCIFDATTVSRRTLTTELRDNGAAGVIIINDFYADIASYYVFPAAAVKQTVGNEILAYLKATSNPVATIQPTTATTLSPAPAVAGFSSRGPNSISQDVIKPDITAPGVNVLAAWAESAPAFYENYNTDKPVFVKYNIISGTSMSCPHVTGALAFVKSAHPDWSPAALKSALMTTATTTDNIKEGILDYNGTVDGPFDYGSGQISPEKALDPGLVYDIAPLDYVAYLCNTGYSVKKIIIITGNKTSSCPKTKKATAGPPLLNYPSIGFTNLVGTQTTSRTLTNVATSACKYAVTVKAPSSNIEVTVSPTSLSFSGAGDKQTYTVTVTSKSSLSSWSFGSLTWSDGTHSVRSPIAVS